MGIGIKKWLKWEFWPFWFFYIPLYVKYLWMSLKAGSMTFFTASNPLMEFSGFTDYSKYNVLKAISKKFLPITEFFPTPTAHVVLEKMKSQNIPFPIILKPDIGERGFGVEKIDSENELNNYFKKHQDIGELLLQEYVDFPLEVGVMYSRKASENKGQITSIVMKEFLTIKGDGISSLGHILKTDKRTTYYLDSLLELYQNELSTILPDGKVKELVAIGNHCRGTTFLNANHLITPELHKVFDEISLPVNGFHFGRYDLRVPSLEDLNSGKNIKIMELNGAASEPAHIYDPEMKLIPAYKHLFAHWQRLYEISRENHKNGVPYTSVWSLYSSLKQRGKFKKQFQ